MALVKQGFIGTAPEQVADLQAELERDPADVLVADSMSFNMTFTDLSAPGFLSPR